MNIGREVKLRNHQEELKKSNESAQSYVVNQLKDMAESLQTTANSEGFGVDYGLGENDNDIGPISIDSSYVSVYANKDITIADFKDSDTFKALGSLDEISSIQFMENKQGSYDIEPLSCMYVEFPELTELIDEALKSTSTCPECGYVDVKNNFLEGSDGSVECPECHEIFNPSKIKAIALIKNRFTFVGLLDRDGAILEKVVSSSVNKGVKEDGAPTYEAGDLYGTDDGNYTIVGNQHGTLTIADDNDNIYDVDEWDFALLNPCIKV
jgi:hypothetical protein